MSRIRIEDLSGVAPLGRGEMQRARGGFGFFGVPFGVPFLFRRRRFFRPVFFRPAFRPVFGPVFGPPPFFPFF
jgi:hypothetical protein